MSKFQLAIEGLHRVDQEAARRAAQDAIHPAARLVVTLGYIITVMSFDKYDLTGLLSMVLFLLVSAILEELPLLEGMARLRLLALPLLFVGLANPLLDKAPIAVIGGVVITGGWVSLVTLFLKGGFAVCATCFLIYQIGMEGLFAALQALHLPPAAGTMLLLIWRYILVFLKEIDRMMQAYRLRAPGQRGLHIRAWGSFVGLLLLRSIDRAGDVYHSMLLRGYTGRIPAREKRYAAAGSALYGVGWLASFWLLRTFPLFVVVGRLF